MQRDQNCESGVVSKPGLDKGDAVFLVMCVSACVFLNL